MEATFKILNSTISLDMWIIFIAFNSVLKPNPCNLIILHNFEGSVIIYYV